MITDTDVLALGCILLAIAAAGLAIYAWQEHMQTIAHRIRAEEADSWADFYQETAKALADQIAAIRSERDTLRERNAHLQALHAERTRQLLAKNYWIVDHNIRRRTGQ